MIQHDDRPSAIVIGIVATILGLAWLGIHLTEQQPDLFPEVLALLVGLFVALVIVATLETKID
jgi:uncharacterized membrane protein YqjE